MPLDTDVPRVEVTTIEQWDRRLDDLDYFELLGVTASAGALEIERAYHRFALQFHPDAHPDCTSSSRRALTRIFQRGVEARQVLSDPRLQRRYRTLLSQGHKRLLDMTSLLDVDLERALPRLHESCRSAGAKLEALNAARAWQQHDLKALQRRLIAALEFDGHANVDIQACLDSVNDLMNR